MREIEFFWDTVSPYTYLAATRLQDLSERTGAVVRWRPFLLGAVMQGSGNRPPAEVPAKGRWMLGDLHALAEHWGVPFRFPSRFPVLTLKAQRVALAADADGLGAAFGLRILSDYWTKDCDPGDDDVLREAATAVGGDGDAWLQAAATPAIKDALRTNSEEAVARGAFGAPTFFVGDRMYWGSDRFELIERALRNG